MFIGCLTIHAKRQCLAVKSGVQFGIDKRKRLHHALAMSRRDDEKTRRKHPAAVALGRLGGAAGRGQAKARSTAQARAAGQAGAAVRWADHVAKRDTKPA